jgi:hypothetical protein
VCCVLFLVYRSWFSDYCCPSIVYLPLAIVFQIFTTQRRQHSLKTSQPASDAAMRFPSLLFAAVAGLWQHPLVSEEETTTSTRHMHVTRTVTNVASTIYAFRMGASTLYMEYLPATLITKSAPWQALQTPHLELRAEETSTMHIKVTQTVAQVGATVFASKVGTSVSTITNAPQSLVEEAAKDAAEISPSQLVAAVKADALTHSTVALLASMPASYNSESTALPSPTQPEPAQFTNSSSPSTSAQLVTSPSSLLPIGLELRSNGGTTADGQLQATTTEARSTVIVVIYGSSTSTMISTSPTLPESTALQTSATSVSSTPRQATSSGHSTQTTQTTQTTQSTQSTQSVVAPVAVDTNAAQIKSIQTALIQASSDAAASTTSSSASSSTTTQGCVGNCASQTFVSTTVFTSSSSLSSSGKVYTIPVTMTDATSSADSAIVPSAAQTSDPATIFTSYGAQSSASTAADIAADNAAGASGGDSGSFKLSKGGFAAIISVVSVGVGLGSKSPISSLSMCQDKKLTAHQ